MLECGQGLSGGSWASLAVLTMVYVVGELSHFILGTVTRPMSQEIHYGDKACLDNPQAEDIPNMPQINCYDGNNSYTCSRMGGMDNVTACVWDYSGLGVDYQLLAGAAFIAIFTTSGIVIALIADRYNRKYVVAICLFILTAATTLMGLATSYWHLVILRMTVGAGESAFSPACSSMISNMFPQTYRALALGIFNWGIYIGYGLSYAIGNFVTEADIGGLGWRWSYFIIGGMGLIVIILLLLVVSEPSREAYIDSGQAVPSTDSSPYKKSRDSFDSIEENGKSATIIGMKYRSGDDLCTLPEIRKTQLEDTNTLEDRDGGRIGLLAGKSRIKIIFQSLCKPSVIMLCIAACVRHLAGFTWAYNTQLYFTTYYPKFNLGIWVTCISIVGGSLGVAIGGLVSDKLVKRLGLRARLYVLAASQFIATPFAAGVLFLKPPWAFYSLLVAYLFAEMWFGVLFAVLLEVVPISVQSTAIAVFLFIMNNVGGNLPILVEPIKAVTSYRIALVILYPGNYLLSSVLFFLTSFLIEKKENTPNKP